MSHWAAAAASSSASSSSGQISSAIARAIASYTGGGGRHAVLRATMQMALRPTSSARCLAAANGKFACEPRLLHNIVKLTVGHVRKV